MSNNLVPRFGQPQCAADQGIAIGRIGHADSTGGCGGDGIASRDARLFQVEVELDWKAFCGAQIDKALPGYRTLPCACAQFGNVQLVVGELPAHPQLREPRSVNVIFVNKVIGAHHAGKLRFLRATGKVGCDANIAGQALIGQRRERE